MKYAHYNEIDGKLLGWYDDTINTSIPEPYIEVTVQGWQEAIDSNYNYVDISTGTLSNKDFSSIQEAQTYKRGEINAKCKEDIVSGFTSNALGVNHVYQTGETDQLNLIGLVASGTDDYFKCGIENQDGSISWEYKLHTIDQLKLVLQHGKVRKLELLQKANSLKEQIASMNSKEGIYSIVW